MAKRKAKDGEEKRGRGRPTKYETTYPELARKFCLLGATNEKLGELFDVTTSTIDKWIAEIPEFSGAVKEGREIADANVGTRLYERAMGYTHDDVHITSYQGEVIVTDIKKHYPPDPTSCIFWLKNRRPDLWRDRHEHTGANGSPLMSEMPDEEIMRRAAFMFFKANHGEQRKDH